MLNTQARARVMMRFAAVGTCAFITAGSANAQVFGADASVTQSDRYPNGGYTNGPDGIFSGGEGDFAAMALLNGSELDFNGSGPWNRGLTRASAALSGAAVNPIAPILRAEARLSGLYSSIPFGGQFPNGAAGFTQAGAIETYQYTGSAPITLTLTYTLHGDFFNDGDTSGLSGIYLSVGVLRDVTFFSTHIGTLTSEGGAIILGHNGSDAEALLLISATTNGFTTQTVSLPFDVVPGQIFSVVARLGANAVGGMSFADAYSTASGTFDRPDLITSISLPTPSAAGLLALGGLAALRRRR